MVVLNDAAVAAVQSLGRAGWQGGVAIALVWVACRVFPKLSPSARCWLWRVAYLKLLLSLFWATPVGLPVLPASWQTRDAPAPPVPVVSPLSPGPSLRSHPTFSSGEAVQSEAVLPMPSHERSAAPNPAVWLLLLWLVGALGYGRRVGREWGISRRLAATGLPITDVRLLERYAVLGLRFGLRRIPRLLLSEEVDSPVLIRALHPALVLPPGILASCTNEELDAILAHELAHLKRQDLLWAWVPTLAQALFFFHPLVWLTRWEWRLAQEIACDELALRVTRVPALQYGQVVLKVAAQRPSPRLGEPAAVGAVGSYRTLRRRLLAIQQFRPVTDRQARTIGAALAFTGVALLVPWRLTEQAAPPEPQRPLEGHSGMGSLLPREPEIEQAPQAGRRERADAARSRPGAPRPRKAPGAAAPDSRREGTDGARQQPERLRPADRVHPLLKQQGPPVPRFRRQRRFRFARYLRERSQGAGVRAKSGERTGSVPDDLEIADINRASRTPASVPAEATALPVEPDRVSPERAARMAATAERTGPAAPHVYLAASGGERREGPPGATGRRADGPTGRRAEGMDRRKVNLAGADLTGQDLSSLTLAGATLTGAHLEGAGLAGMDLSGADLSSAHLKGARMARANLTGANLSGSDLSQADLSQARVEKGNLSGANLRGARLERANLMEANLSGADLTGALVAGARLDRADLSGADLSGVDLSRARLHGANLSGARRVRTRRSSPDLARYLSASAGPAVRRQTAGSRARGRAAKSGASCPAPAASAIPSASPAPLPAVVLDVLNVEQVHVYLEQVLRQAEQSRRRTTDAPRQARPIRHERERRADQQDQEQHSDCPADLDTD